MATATLAPKQGNAAVNTFVLRSTSANGAQWAVGSRSLSKPYTIDIARKIGNSSALGNDHVLVTINRTEGPTAPETKFATAKVTLDISIPRGVLSVTADMVNGMLAEMSSLLNDCAAVEEGLANHGNIIALIGGSDL